MELHGVMVHYTVTLRSAIELSVKWYPICFLLLFPPPAIVILYLYYVLTPLQPLYSQF
jgi:hypothetical protein